MRVLTMIELMRLSRIELCELLSQTTKSLPELSIGTIEGNTALTNLLNICRILPGRELVRGYRNGPASEGFEVVIHCSRPSLWAD